LWRADQRRYPGQDQQRVGGHAEQAAFTGPSPKPASLAGSPRERAGGSTSPAPATGRLPPGSLRT
jgi:hypothetical protein